MKAVKNQGGGSEMRDTLDLTLNSTPPVVELLSPAADNVVGGVVSYRASASASDDVGVAGVEFYIDGDLLGSDSSAPYELAWDTRAFANDTHLLQVVAVDLAGNDAASPARSVQVFNDITAPVVNIVSPASGSSVTGLVAISVDATDDVGVDRVELYIDDSLNGTDTTAPYSFQWDAASAVPGSHALVARAYDAVGNVGLDADTSLTVAEPNVTPPPDPATVAPELDASVATSLCKATEFLYAGAVLIQTGVAAGAIRCDDASLLRGLVKDAAGQPLSGVVVRIKDHEEIGQTLSRLDGAGNVVSYFVYRPGRHLPEYMIKGGSTYQIITDLAGSARLVVDVSTGGVAQELRYDAYGRILADSNPGFQPFGFAGGIYDSHTGLTRFGVRDYDPEHGRFTAKDPVGFAGGAVNLYSYVSNDPVNLSDPRGTDEVLTALQHVQDAGDYAGNSLIAAKVPAYNLLTRFQGLAQDLIDKDMPTSNLARELRTCFINGGRCNFAEALFPTCSQVRPRNKGKKGDPTDGDGYLRKIYDEISDAYSRGAAQNHNRNLNLRQSPESQLWYGTADAQ